MNFTTSRFSQNGYILDTQYNPPADGYSADFNYHGSGTPYMNVTGINLLDPSIYGMRTFGDYMPARQTLGFVRLCRAISAVASDLADQGASHDYVNALATYAAGVVARKVRRSGRAATLDIKVQAAHDIFSNQGCNPMEQTAAAMGTTPFW